MSGFGVTGAELSPSAKGAPSADWGSPLMRQVLDKVARAASTRSTVLLTGETGTGKGVVARLIHQRSPPRGRPLHQRPLRGHTRVFAGE